MAQTKTFIERYQEALATPTAFIEQMQEITGRSKFAVQSWGQGRRQPDILAAKAIADAFGVEDWHELFPDKKG